MRNASSHDRLTPARRTNPNPKTATASTKMDFFRGSQSKRFEQEIYRIGEKEKDSSLQNDYIKGLQEEVKLLEYELKLLKDRALNDKNKLSEYDAFMSDDLDINENILAMKTKYIEVKSNL
jgi:hypothetical protein